MKYKLNPRLDKVVLKLVESRKTASGIDLGNSSNKDTFQKGEVIAFGPGRLLRDGSFSPLGLEIGQIVLFDKSGSVRVPAMGEEFWMTRDAEIWTTIEEVEDIV